MKKYNVGKSVRMDLNPLNKQSKDRKQALLGHSFNKEGGSKITTGINSSHVSRSFDVGHNGSNIIDSFRSNFRSSAHDDAKNIAEGSIDDWKNYLK